jgi:heat shock protein HslJ
MVNTQPDREKTGLLVIPPGSPDKEKESKVKNLTHYLIVLCLIALALTACGGAKGSAAALEGTAWTLLSYGMPNSPQAVQDGTKITLEFDAEGGIKGSAGCNTYFGSYKVKGTKLTIGPIAITEMYCMSPEGVMEQEKVYAEVLSSAESLAVQDEQLRITSADGQILVFNTAASGR